MPISLEVCSHLDSPSSMTGFAGVHPGHIGARDQILTTKFVGMVKRVYAMEYNRETRTILARELNASGQLRWSMGEQRGQPWLTA